MNTLEEIMFYIKRGKPMQIRVLIPLALSEGYSAERIMDEALLPAMDEVSRLFITNEMFVPEVLESARAMNAGLHLIKPHFVQSGIGNMGTIVIGTVKGDMHNIGKNIVSMMLEGKGFKVVDLGVDIEPIRFIEAARSQNAQIICCSCLLSNAMLNMEEIVRLRNQAGLKGRVAILIGGAPLSQAFCDRIGADYFAVNAGEAADIACQIVQKDLGIARR